MAWTELIGLGVHRVGCWMHMIGRVGGANDWNPDMSAILKDGNGAGFQVAGQMQRDTTKGTPEGEVAQTRFDTAL